MANGLPDIRETPPLLGLSETQQGRLDVPVADVGVPLGIEEPVLGPIPTPPELKPITQVAPVAPTSLGPTVPLVGLDVAAPDVQQPVLEPGVIPAPAAPAQPLEFAPEPVTPRAEIDVGVRPAFVESQLAVQKLSQDEDVLARRGDELLFELGAATSEKRRRALEEEAQANNAARERNAERLAVARGMRDRNEAVEAARLGDAIRQREADARLAMEEQLLQFDADRQIDAEEAARESEGSQARLADARERHAQIIERGPKANFQQTALAVITEALKPLATPGGTADYGHVVSTLIQQNEAQWKREVDAAKLRAEIAGDEIGNVARRRKEEQKQMAVIREQTARRLRLATERELQGITNEFDRARALTFIDDLKRQEADAQHRQQALAVGEARKAALENAKLRKTEADIELVQARTLAERQKAIADAAKAARAGRGGRGRVSASSLFGREISSAVDNGQLDEKGAKVVFEQGVIDPVTGELTRRADGSFVLATSPKVAQDLNSSGARVATVNSLVNQAIALRGAEGWEPTSVWYSSEAGKRMAGLSTELLLINKDIFGLGVLSDSDTELLQKLQGGELAGLQDPRPALRDMRDRMIAAYNQRRRSLAPGSQALKFARPGAPRQRTLAETRSVVRTAFDEATGTVPSVNDRFAAFQETTSLLERERDSKFEAESQAKAEARSFINRVAPREQQRISDALEEAQREGDDQRAAVLAESLRKSKAFQRRMRIELTRLERRTTEEARMREEGRRVASELTGRDLER